MKKTWILIAIIASLILNAIFFFGIKYSSHWLGEQLSKIGLQRKAQPVWIDLEKENFDSTEKSR